MIRPLVMLAFVVLLSGCAESSDSRLTCDTPAVQPVLGESFNLRYGEQTALAGGNLSLTFVQVLEESRCPTGVQCIWEGNAQIGLKAEHPTSSSATLTLNTSSRYDTEATYQAYKVQLLHVVPYPKQGRSLEASDYCANLKVIHAQGTGA